MDLEKHLPFIAQIVAGAITWAATLAFLRQYLGLMTVVLLVALLVFRLEPWALIASFLVGLAIELFSAGATDQLRVVLLLLAGGSLLQLLVALSPGASADAPSSRRQNTLFAVIGIVLCRVAQFATCPAGRGVSLSSGFGEAFMGMLNCHVRRAMETLGEAYAASDTDPAVWNAVAIVFLQTLLVAPFVWASVFAALRQTRFNLLRPGRIIRQSLRAGFGISLTGLLGYLAIVVFLVIAYAIAQGTEIGSTPLSGGYASMFVVILLGIDAFFTALGAGWGASWGY